MMPSSSAGVAVCLLAVLLLAQPALAQVPPVPPEIQAILQKAAAGQELTEAEQKAVDAYSQARQKQIQELLKRKPRPASANASAKAAEEPCPKPLGKVLPTRAPTREEHLALVRQLLATYGGRVGKAKTQLDSALGTASRPTEAADLGAMLVAARSGSSAAYTTLWALSKAPDDFIGLNNLGVILTATDDHAAALSLLFYADSLKPQVALTAVNIGWVYYDVGEADKAKVHFEKAARLSPELSGAHLGLGLLAECRGDHLEAMIHLRDSMQNGFSAVGAAAYRGARAAVSKSSQGDASQGEPISKEKGSTDDFQIPEAPISENRAKTKAAQPQMERVAKRMQDRATAAHMKAMSVFQKLRQQREQARSSPGSLVLAVTYEKERFLLHDIAVLTLGEPSVLGQAQRQSAAYRNEALKSWGPRHAEDAQNSQKSEGFQRREDALRDEYERCNLNVPCQKAVDARGKALRYEWDQEKYRHCKQIRSHLEYVYATEYKAWKTDWDAVREATRDYYAFSAPVIRRVYEPTLNEWLNVTHEAEILSRVGAVYAMGSALPGRLESIDELECVEPEPPQPEAAVSEKQNVPKAEPIPCPFKSPATVKLLVVSASLDCEKFKIEGGEGFVWSIERNFKRHETTVGIGVGAQAATIAGSVGAKTMIEVRVGDNDVVQDVALNSSVAVKVGSAATGFGVESELAGRISLEGGPSVTMETKLGFEGASLGLGGSAGSNTVTP